jgi:hypothetical protein
MDDPRVEGNRRLTGWLGLTLLVTLVVEYWTIWDREPRMPLHVTVGLLLIPIAIVKLAPVSWRMASYYLRREPWHAAGPPAWNMRIASPILVLSVAVVLITGVLLVTDTGISNEQSLRTWHRQGYIVLTLVLGAHVAVHVGTALLGAWRDLRAPGRRLVVRLAIVALAIIAAFAFEQLLPHSTPEQRGDDHLPPGATSRDFSGRDFNDRG